ncbi:MAG TPA: type II secretion system inner membrane protein GspF [Xanthomonadaceae bacterium]|nr:type II secretion system inner membrane protein GspF [Xanthomonadaceae bacterium]
MPLYRYQALSAAGETLNGQMEAASADDVVSRLQDQGHIPVQAIPADQAPAEGLLGGLMQRRDMSAAQVLQFTQQLATLLGAGQPLDRALQILLDLPESERARRVVERIRDDVRGGASLSEALDHQHGVFSRLYVNMVRAGEVGGSLHDTLSRLAEYLERSKALREQVINAMIYPAILVLLVFGALLVLLGYVVPSFLPMFEEMGQEMPLITRVVLSIGTAVQSWWWLMIALSVGGVLTLRQQLKLPDKRLVFDTWLLRRGLVGQLIAKVETARLARTLGTLVRNGVPLLTALSVARNVLNNTALVAALDEAADEVKTGGGLAWALTQSKRFPRLAMQMIQVGEESGELDAMLERTADTFDGEAKNTVNRLLAALVPAITILMAVVVAFIMLAILLPILQMSSTMG